jgi:hypothetical protein
MSSDKSQPASKIVRMPFTGIREGVCNMKPIDLHQFYNLGVNLQPLSSLATGQLLADVVWNLMSAKFELQRHVLEDSILPGSSKRAADALISLIRSIVPERVEDISKIAKDRVISNYEFYVISNALTTFNTVLASDFPEIAVYFVEKKGTHNTDDLIRHAEHMFSEQIRARLPESVINDLRSAGTCIAFDLHTGAGFHLLRAIEGVVRQYCGVVAGKQPKSRNWGAWITMLKSRKAPEDITAMLEHIKNTYRNKIMHPEIELDNDDAVVLFGITQSAILMMMKDSEARKSAVKTATLGVIPTPPALGTGAATGD